MLAATLVNCGGSNKSENTVLSRVGSRILMLDEAVNGIPSAELRSDSARAISDYVEAWERRAILSLEAERNGLTDSPDVKRQLEHARDQVLSDAMLRLLQSRLDTVRLTSSDWADIFDSNPTFVKVSEPSLKVYHFWDSARDTVYALHDAMSRRDRRDDVLRKVQESNTDWWALQQMPRTIRQLEGEYPALGQFWRSSGTNRLSDVVSDNGNWHFFWVEGPVAVGTALDTSLVRPYIEDWLLVQKKNRRLRALEQSIIMNAQQTNLLQRQ